MNSPENSRAPEKQKSRFTRRQRIGAGLTALSLTLGGGSVLGKEALENREEQHELRAAEAIAERRDCKLAEVNDLQTRPDPFESSINLDPNERTTVSIGLAVSDPNPEAAPYLAEYADDDSVMWREHPDVSMLVHTGGAPVGADEGLATAEYFADTRVDQETGIVYNRFAPKNTYDDGTRASIWAEDIAFTGLKPGDTLVTSRQYCGEAIYDQARGWTIVPAKEALQFPEPTRTLSVEPIEAGYN